MSGERSDLTSVNVFFNKFQNQYNNKQSSHKPKILNVQNKKRTVIDDETGTCATEEQRSKIVSTIKDNVINKAKDIASIFSKNSASELGQILVMNNAKVNKGKSIMKKNDNSSILGSIFGLNSSKKDSLSPGKKEEPKIKAIRFLDVLTEHIKMKSNPGDGYKYKRRMQKQKTEKNYDYNTLIEEIGEKAMNDMPSGNEEEKPRNKKELDERIIKISAKLSKMFKNFNKNKIREENMLNNKIRKHDFIDKVEMRKIMQKFEMGDVNIITDMDEFMNFLYNFYQKNRFLVSNNRPGMKKKLNQQDKVTPPTVWNDKSKKNDLNGGIFKHFHRSYPTAKDMTPVVYSHK